MNRDRKRTLIVGAGEAGKMILREMNINPKTGYLPVGFVDDDLLKQGKEIDGLVVLGTVNAIRDLIQPHSIDLVLIAIPSASSVAIRLVVNLCRQAGVPYKTLPFVDDLLECYVTLNQVRDVEIDDLLCREPVSIDVSQIEEVIRGKTILITGAAGSIGSELVRQVSRFSPGKIILFDRNENGLFSLLHSFEGGDERIVPFIGDIQDVECVEGCMQEFSPEIVFHAAAYKHVSMMERTPREAFKNNALGTLVLSRSALKHKVEKFILVSTDKAVDPVNVMGITKHIAEKIVLQANGKGTTKFMAVRFGNVLGSNGSVVPIFQQQIVSGGPVTVTSPEVTRFFMTIHEAGQLLLQASSMGRGGEIFILDMGAPVRILDLAENLIRLSGKVPGKDIAIIFTGLKEGEKLHEILSSEFEKIIPTRHVKIKQILSEEMNLLFEEYDVREILEKMKEVGAYEAKEILQDFIKLECEKEK